MPETLELDGEHTNATVMIDEVEETCLDQIQSMIDHEARYFQGGNHAST